MRKIIVLKKENINNFVQVSYIFRLEVPSAHQTFRADANATSMFKEATEEEIAAIKAGQYIEQQGTASFSTGVTAGQIGTNLISKYNSAQPAITNSQEFNFYGTSWDGKSWTIVSA